jgi:hypothetical protein
VPQWDDALPSARWRCVDARLEPVQKQSPPPNGRSDYRSRGRYRGSERDAAGAVPVGTSGERDCERNILVIIYLPQSV